MIRFNHRGFFSAGLLSVFLSLHGAECGWEKLENCRLERDQYFAGDSFRVFRKSQEMIVRLYSVDCPEMDNGIPDRVKTQARHFGKTIEETLHVGSLAKEITAQLVSRRFTVITQFENAMGRSSLPQYYAFITTVEGEDLGEILVKNGLARAFGRKAEPPGKSPPQYDRFEARAKRAGLGIYSPAPLQSVARSTGNEINNLKPILESNSTTVILENTRPAAATRTQPTPKNPAVPRAPEKRNINMASKAELENVPGIGATTAEKIIQARPFLNINELRKIGGIGDVKLESISRHSTVQ